MAVPDIDKLFLETVKGRYPLSNGPSTARFWSPTIAEVEVEYMDTSTKPATLRTESKPVDGRYVPRPDRSLVVLQALSLFGFLGLDHFYLRNTKTAVIKLITLGGLGIWWLWDMLQVFLEKDRIVNYGLTAPFDLQTGIGQGMITDRHTEYSQQTDWVTWTMSTLFGFAGSTYFFMGRFALGLRFLLITLLASGPTIMFAAEVANGSVGLGSVITSIFWVILFVLGVGPVFVEHAYKAIFDPTDLMMTGLPTPQIS
jgi:TM2 domain-containing membrane protein YozV